MSWHHHASSRVLVILKGDIEIPKGARSHVKSMSLVP